MKKILAVSLLLILTTPLLTGCAAGAEILRALIWRNQYWSNTFQLDIATMFRFAVKKGDYVFAPDEDVTLDAYFALHQGGKPGLWYEGDPAEFVFGVYTTAASDTPFVHGEAVRDIRELDGCYFVREIPGEEAFSDEYFFDSKTVQFPFRHHESVTFPREMFEREKNDTVYIMLCCFKRLSDPEPAYQPNWCERFLLYYKRLADGSLRISGQQIM